MRITIKTLAGLEEVLAKELAALGAEEIEQGVRVVYCQGDLRLVYRANLELRTALRVLIEVNTFQASNEEELYRGIRRIRWDEYLSADGTLAVDATVNSDFFRHSKYAALKTKDAIVDQFRAQTGRRPSVDVNYPDLRINLHIYKDNCTVSLDSSGDSLHKRGYRTEGREAPINEVLAAGMLLLTGWDLQMPFIDPMCGSGTLAIEAGLLAYNIPPQLTRHSFGFQAWRDYNRNLWEEVVREAESRIRKSGPTIIATDRDFGAVKVTNQNILAAHLEGKIEVERKRFEQMEPPTAPGILLMNPPYDERLPLADTEAFYKMIGDRLKQAYTGYEAWIISSNMEALKVVGLRPSRRLSLFNGALPCKLLKFELYAGTRKVRPGEHDEEN